MMHGNSNIKNRYLLYVVLIISNTAKRNKYLTVIAEISKAKFLPPTFWHTS